MADLCSAVRQSKPGTSPALNLAMHVSNTDTIFIALHAMQRGLATRKLSVSLSVHLSVKRVIRGFVTKPKKVVPTFLYHVKDHSF